MDGWVDDELMDWSHIGAMEENNFSCHFSHFDSWHKSLHMMGSIINKFKGMGIDGQQIPTGCTYLCQSVDVGINHPLKKILWNDGRSGCMKRVDLRMWLSRLQQENDRWIDHPIQQCNQYWDREKCMEQKRILVNHLVIVALKSFVCFEYNFIYS